MGVDVGTVVTQEADQRDAQTLGGLHRDTRWRSNGGHDRNAGDGGLLHELETGAPRDERDHVMQR